MPPTEPKVGFMGEFEKEANDSSNLPPIMPRVSLISI